MPQRRARLELCLSRWLSAPDLRARCTVWASETLAQVLVQMGVAYSGLNPRWVRSRQVPPEGPTFVSGRTGLPGRLTRPLCGGDVVRVAGALLSASLVAPIRRSKVRSKGLKLCW
jgi:hypothetical protein